MLFAIYLTKFDFKLITLNTPQIISLCLFLLSDIEQHINR